MGNMQARLDIKEASKKRMKGISFGDAVTNICAGEGNPHKHAYFVEYIVKSRVNRYGINHNEYLAKCTDKKRRFWNTCIDVIHPGHLDSEKCTQLFSPVWDAEYL